MADMIENGSEVVIARGGRGGKGNWVFKSSTNQARASALGEEGVEFNLQLELKLLADVGLVGFQMPANRRSFLRSLPRNQNC